LSALVLGLGLLPLVGCSGEKTAEVSGTVTLNNQPLASGVVTFFPETGAPVAVFIQNGSYTASGIGYGNCRVSVAPQVEAPAPKTDAGGKTMKPGQSPTPTKGAPMAVPKKDPAPASPIPEKYRNADTSDLNCKIDQSKVTYPITLN
jgi:hypothetical protein